MDLISSLNENISNLKTKLECYEVIQDLEYEIDKLLKSKDDLNGYKCADPKFISRTGNVFWESYIYISDDKFEKIREIIIQSIDEQVEEREDKIKKIEKHLNGLKSR